MMEAGTAEDHYPLRAFERRQKQILLTPSMGFIELDNLRRLLNAREQGCAA